VVTDADGADAAEVPTAFFAVTVKVYAVTTVSPVTTMVPEVRLPPMVRAPVIPPGVEVAV
jgi:hypothetical protein